MVAIEADCMYAMASSAVLPVYLEYKSKIASSVMSYSNGNNEIQEGMLKKLNGEIDGLIVSLNRLKSTKEKAEDVSDVHNRATYYCKEVREAMANVRSACDTLETIVDDGMWPFAKYSEMLFLK
jgi:glutamine synthetase